MDEGFVKGWMRPCAGLRSSPNKTTAFIQAERVVRFQGRFAAQRRASLLATTCPLLLGTVLQPVWVAVAITHR